MTAVAVGEMLVAFYEDLTPYIYGRLDEGPAGAVNIGWLEPEHPFTTGETSGEFRRKLARLCDRRVNQIRGFQLCRFCAGPDQARSSAEMRVEYGGRVYAAPSMVYHYVTAHSYRPPEEFITAVLAWDGEDV